MCLNVYSNAAMVLNLIMLNLNLLQSKIVQKVKGETMWRKWNEVLEESENWGSNLQQERFQITRLRQFGDVELVI